MSGCDAFDGHLGYPTDSAKPESAANQRDGKGAKTVLTGEGPVRIEVPPKHLDHQVEVAR